MATGVSVESEYYYRVIAHDLNKDTSHWERKAHIFIFDTAEDWKMFQTKASLDPWTGGIHAHGELFLPRYPGRKFQGNTLGHETAHLIVDRFYGSNVPLWLNEGYAEYISRVYYAAYYRTRGYASHASTDHLALESYQPLEQLTNALTYPADVKDVLAFYVESEKLVRFLNAADKSKFQVLLDALSKGSLFENALHSAFGIQFPSVHQLEDSFKPYATQPEAVGAPATTVMNP